ncbi:MAG: RCC1 domain-containing protein [Bdellovibrio sp.]
MYVAVILSILAFGVEYAFGAQHHFNNQLLANCPDAKLSFQTAENLRVAEGSGSVNLVVSLTKRACFNTQIEYGYYSGTGVIGTHFSAEVAGTVTIPKGQKTATISFSILQNALQESEKTLFITLRGAKGTKQKITLKENSSKQILITDDESTYGTITQFATSGNASCIIIGGVLKCWGENSTGSVGDGTTVTKPNPVVINGGTSYSKVSMNSSGAVCAITGTGVLKCWGSNYSGSVGDGTTLQRNAPVIIDGGQAYSEIATGFRHTCGITNTNVLKCWGDNSKGELGDGTTTNSTTPKVITVAGVTFAKVAAGGYNGGGYHTCAISTDGDLYCWGSNSKGELGDNTTTDNATPGLIDSGTKYALVKLGGYSTCGITTTGVLKCWGSNASGLLGDGTLVATRLVPTTIDAGQNYLDVAISDVSTCGVTSSNKMKCWGDNTYYNLGNWTKTGSRLPIAIDSNENYSSVFVNGGALNAAPSSACGVTTTGGLKCWGNNNGQMVFENSSRFNSIRQISQSLTFSKFSVGEFSMCGITPSNSLYCWGANNTGQVGDRTQINRDYAVLIDPNTKYSMVDVGSSSNSSTDTGYACAITTTNELKCWGLNDNSKLGDGTTTTKMKPKVIDYGVQYSTVSVGSIHTCAVTTDGILKCWGANAKGQLGIGSTTAKSTPTVVDSGVTYSSVVVSATYNNGNVHTCGITTDGDLKCWGSNNQGQLGDGTTTASLIPVVIDSGVKYSKVKIGAGFLQGFTCGITTGQKIKCWGSNTYGGLGVGDTTQRLSPTVVDAANSYKALAAKGEIACAVTVAGRMRCWGYNFYKLVGDNTTTNRLAPVDIDAATVYDDVDVGHTAWVEASNCGIESTTLNLRCWGFNESGAMALPNTIGIPAFIPRVQVP